jgi:transcriptional regulator with XRE-family HTH domain
MKRESLLRSKEYVTSQIQLNLLNLMGEYKKNKNLKDYQLAEKLGVSKGYISQILHATYDHKISKLAELALACNAMPLIYFVDLDQFIFDDSKGKLFELVPVKPKKKKRSVPRKPIRLIESR